MLRLETFKVLSFDIVSLGLSVPGSCDGAKNGSSQKLTLTSVDVEKPAIRKSESSSLSGGCRDHINPPCRRGPMIFVSEVQVDREPEQILFGNRSVIFMAVL